MEENDEIIDIGEEDSVDNSASLKIPVSDEVSSSLAATPPPEASISNSHGWESNEYNLHGVDEDSRALIEQMLAEEQYYYGVDTLSTMSLSNDTKRKNKSKDSAIKKRGTKKVKMQPDQAGDENVQLKKIQKKSDDVISSASLPSHKTRWTAEEDELLRAALLKHGYGNWKVISEDIKTRNPLQCKNHARHWMLSNKLNGIAVPSKEISDKPKDASLPSKDTEDDENISVEDDGIDVADDLLIDDYAETTTDSMENDSKLESQEPSPKGDEMNALSDSVEENASPIMGNEQVAEINIKQETTLSEVDRPNAKEAPAQETENEIPDAEEAKLVETRPQIIKADTDDTNIPNPSDHRLDNKDEDSQVIQAAGDQRFDRYVISEEEKLENAEWFNNKQSKTPARYLKIRNHMLDCWNACKPRYLTKTSARRGLRDCGDVNAIGRVHTYLESIGAINVDCITNAPRPPKRTSADIADDDEANMFIAADMVIGYDGPRKRKVRNGMGEWVDPKELEGRVIEHGVVKETGPTSRPKRVSKRPRHYYGGDDFGRGYDPFRLVPLQHYEETYPAPFTVEVTSDVLCEMDPASEMKAREVFAGRGFNVVGWYHSHPTFEPQPSIRDIENQTSYQTLFRNDKTGDEPFIGMIVTPYDEEIVSDHSIIQYLHISNHWNESRSFRLPYACRRLVRQSEQVSPEVLERMRELVQEYKGYEHKVDMTCSFRQQTRLDKLLDSLRANLFLVQECTNSFLDKVREMVMEQFVDAKEKIDKETEEEKTL
ncbi:Myb-like, SWIRM and MPN domains 1 [Apophysomyces ossiformis]|uniref:Myb-like, SWIRM and MPN domains 1 n=1 Tax=Apophysomyces ossiformis TaxID=679940 RepID=A0A8H7BQK8_9FUNG|nr:Myb-like, SWIRM and MPN domains 1 [Apophysomyces ossiformis]